MNRTRSSNGLRPSRGFRFRRSTVLSRPPEAVFCMALTALLLFSGCGPKSEEPEKDQETAAQTQITPSVTKQQIKSVVPTRSEVMRSPADAVDKLPEEKASPQEVCQRFMELLRSGNRVTAENLLTRAALTATSKAGLQLEPMGGPTAVFEMGGTRFATIKEELAHVDCEIVEQINGQEVRSEITWMMRKQRQGWRVAGLLVEMETGQSKDLLSFENETDVERIKGLAAADLPDSQESRQADASSTESSDLK